MNEKMYEVLKKFEVYDNIELEKIIDGEVYEAFKDSILCGTFSGWGSDLYLNDEGELNLSGLMSYNSQSMESWEGTEVCLATIKGNYEIGNITEHYIFTEEEEKILRDYYYETNFIDEEEKEVLDKKSIYHIYNYDFDDVVKNCLEELYNELLEETIQTEWGYYKDDLYDEIKCNIKNYITCHEYEDRYNNIRSECNGKYSK